MISLGLAPVLKMLDSSSRLRGPAGVKLQNNSLQCSPEADLRFLSEIAMKFGANLAFPFSARAGPECPFRGQSPTGREFSSLVSFFALRARDAKGFAEAFKVRLQAVVFPADGRLPCRLSRNPGPSLPS